jgi:hypothetical protein
MILYVLFVLLSLQVCMDDIECHSYQEIETIAPNVVSSLDPMIKLVVDEMLKFKDRVIDMLH